MDFLLAKTAGDSLASTWRFSGVNFLHRNVAPDSQVVSSGGVGWGRSRCYGRWASSVVTGYGARIWRGRSVFSFRIYSLWRTGLRCEWRPQRCSFLGRGALGVLDDCPGSSLIGCRSCRSCQAPPYCQSCQSCRSCHGCYWLSRPWVWWALTKLILCFGVQAHLAGVN